MYNIRYIKLCFNVKIIGPGIMPAFKNSALRGGMGRELMKFSCLNDGNCYQCSIKDSCLVNDVMFSKFEKQPEIVSSKNSVGYIIECFDKREKFETQDTFKFNVILIGKTIAYISHFIYAFDVLGSTGIGKYNCKYKLINVTDEDRKIIFSNGIINKNNIKIKTVGDYITKRRDDLVNYPQLFMNLVTPLRYKANGRYRDKIDIQDLGIVLNRRFYILNCFEGNNCSKDIKTDYSISGEITEEMICWHDISRYSFKQKTEMKLGGVTGIMNLNIKSDDFLDLLIAGELLHTGKNTSFGLGKYILS